MAQVKGSIIVLRKSISSVLSLCSIGGLGMLDLKTCIRGFLMFWWEWDSTKRGDWRYYIEVRINKEKII